MRSLSSLPASFPDISDDIIPSASESLAEFSEGSADMIEAITSFTIVSALNRSFPSQGFLSLDSSSSQIIEPLIIRGIVMGIIFATLGTLALNRIPPHKLAGFRPGVAVMGTILSHQVVVHTTNYFQALNRNSPAFQQLLLSTGTI